MIRRTLLLAAALILGVYGVASAAGGVGGGGGGGKPTTNSKPVQETTTTTLCTTSTTVDSNLNTGGGGNGQGTCGSGTPGDNAGGCRPENRTRTPGEQQAIDDVSCPGYNGNVDNNFTISTSDLQVDVQFTASGGWCATGSVVTFTWDPDANGPTSPAGSTTTELNRRFTDVPLKIESGAVLGTGKIIAHCSHDDREAIATLSA